MIYDIFIRAIEPIGNKIFRGRNMRKIIGIFIGLSMILSMGIIVSAATIQDSVDDVAHWSAGAGGYGWTSVSVGNRPNIDITELRQNVVGDTMVFELTVDGIIQDTSLNYYWATFNTSDSYYWFSWSNGQGGGIATNLVEFRMDAEPEISASGDTITAVFDIVGDDLSASEFWGYAWEYTTYGNIATAEWWGDWAPEEFTPYDEDDILNPVDQDTDDSDISDQQTDNNNQKPPTQTDTPGFEIIILLAAVFFIVYIRKNN
jgi:hypothetical protein